MCHTGGGGSGHIGIHNGCASVRRPAPTSGITTRFHQCQCPLVTDRAARAGRTRWQGIDGCRCCGCTGASVDIGNRHGKDLTIGYASGLRILIVDIVDSGGSIARPAPGNRITSRFGEVQGLSITDRTAVAGGRHWQGIDNRDGRTGAHTAIDIGHGDREDLPVRDIRGCGYHGRRVGDNSTTAARPAPGNRITTCFFDRQGLAVTDRSRICRSTARQLTHGSHCRTHTGAAIGIGDRHRKRFTIHDPGHCRVLGVRVAEDPTIGGTPRPRDGITTGFHQLESIPLTDRTVGGGLARRIYKENRDACTRVATCIIIATTRSRRNEAVEHGITDRARYEECVSGACDVGKRTRAAPGAFLPLEGQPGGARSTCGKKGICLTTRTDQLVGGHGRARDGREINVEGNGKGTAESSCRRQCEGSAPADIVNAYREVTGIKGNAGIATVCRPRTFADRAVACDEILEEEGVVNGNVTERGVDRYGRT